MAYSFQKIEKKWQKYWEENNTNATSEDYTKPKYYVLDMFPYPSGDGLHIGHPEGYTATDIIARHKKMQGYNVLHPMGFDAFGLPTERYAMVNGIHPSAATEKNIANFKRQLQMLGFGYDWNREINTTVPEFYRWTQWMFLLIYNSWFDDIQQRARPISELPIPSELTDNQEIERYRDGHRLAYVDNIPVNWCEQLGTVLANEEIDEWKEKGYDVVRRPMRQWMVRITKFADRLLQDLDAVDWVPSTKEMQKHWIGKSIGAEIDFSICDGKSFIRVFTTRPDTIFGATYLVLAPEHPLTDIVATEEYQKDIQEYRDKSGLKSDLERTELQKEKTGIFTGGFAINPATGNKIPIWIADYVLGHYGTGAIMAVPGHDDRDFEFAQQFSLPIVKVVVPNSSLQPDANDKENIEGAYTGDGIATASSNDEISLNGLTTSEVKETINTWLEQKNIGKRKTQYRLRDWLFSRQRYWGEPIPILWFEDGSKRSLEHDELPLELPEVSDFMPAGTGESPLAKIDGWVRFYDKKTGKYARIETNTMPQWAGSCWYYLRYIDPLNKDSFCDSEKERYWMGETGVDLYVGGAEHAVLHLLYARFWHKTLYDYGLVSTTEPFKRLFHQGLILGDDNKKMSKSLGNVVSPDRIVEQYGADALRVFEMFMGPLEAAKPWSEKGVEGSLRFLSRAWRMIADEHGQRLPSVQAVPSTKEQEYILNSTIKKVSNDIEQLSMNTAVAQMMIFVNEFTKAEVRPLQAMKSFVQCLAPFAPHIAEELWQILGGIDSVFHSTFPECDESTLVLDNVEIVLQVNSKIRSKAWVSASAENNEMEKTALSDSEIQKFIEGKSIRKMIVVPGKLVNIIVG